MYFWQINSSWREKKIGEKSRQLNCWNPGFIFYDRGTPALLSGELDLVSPL